MNSSGPDAEHDQIGGVQAAVPSGVGATLGFARRQPTRILCSRPAFTASSCGESLKAQAALVVELNKTIALEARYATLVHELGHVYCGHLGVPPDAWWPDRSALNIRPREFEAEAVAWIVCSRQGLDPGSYRYLESYLGTNKDVPDISLNQVMVAANYIEMLGTERFRRKKLEGKRRPKRPEISGIVSLNTGEPLSEEAIQAKEVQEHLALAAQNSLVAVEEDDV